MQETRPDPLVLSKTDNTLIIPSNLNDAASFIASAMTVLERTKSGSDAQR